MSTVIKDRHGKTVREVQDTTYHPDGTGPRDADGRPISENEPAGIEPDLAQALATELLGVEGPKKKETSK